MIDKNYAKYGIPLAILAGTTVLHILINLFSFGWLSGIAKDIDVQNFKKETNTSLVEIKSITKLSSDSINALTVLVAQYQAHAVDSDRRMSNLEDDMQRIGERIERNDIKIKPLTRQYICLNFPHSKGCKSKNNRG